MIISVLHAPLPCLTLILMNTFLILFAMKKSLTKINKMNIMIVFLVTCVFLSSFLPYFAFYVVYPEYDDGIDGLRVVTLLPLVSSCANPAVYYLTNPSFRRFTRDFVRRKGTFVGTTITSNNVLFN